MVTLYTIVPCIPLLNLVHVEIDYLKRQSLETFSFWLASFNSGQTTAFGLGHPPEAAVGGG
ncbi:MAG: hypothetical protein ACO3NK_03810 [Prochlorotrichaceae cyanobacterium]|jgi:hypothetical protein